MEQKKATVRDTIVYKGKKYHRYPESKRWALRSYYWRHDKWKQAPQSLHRQIWIDAHGEIPDGCIIHHKDHNPLNNELDNLACISAEEHCAHHVADRQKTRKAVCQYKYCGKTFEYRNFIRTPKFCRTLCWRRHRNGTQPSGFMVP